MSPLFARELEPSDTVAPDAFRMYSGEHKG